MPLKWRKQWISDETYESAGVFDADGDGVLDIVSGAFWYQGPDFRKKHPVGDVKKYGEYYDDFSTIALDIDGDGKLDFVTGGWWGGNLRWRRNPGQAGQEWPETVIAEVGNVETTRAWDIDGCGTVEIVPNTPCHRPVSVLKLRRDAAGKPTGQFDKHVVFEFPEGQSQAHGHGCGDIAGNGRKDLVFAKGWLECPANPWKDKWTWHADFDLVTASNPILVEDINGDGRSELIYGAAHNYGLWWMQQELKAGKRTWTKHVIDADNAQYHDMMWVDIDGDGKKELVTGKRHRAHCGNDPGEWDDYGMYYFKWTGGEFTKNVISYGPIGRTKGCGIFFQAVDLRGTGRLDLVLPGKDGLWVFWNEGL